MKRSTVLIVFLCVFLLFSWGCAQKSAKLQKSIQPPDKTLFETGNDYLQKSQYIKARLSFQTLMSTYPDSELAPDAVLAIGDSFYDEGGTENLLLAEDQYKNFIVFFPTNPKAQEAQMKIIALNRKMMRAPDRDQQYSYKALEAVDKFLALYPDSDYAPIVKQIRLEVQEVLAKQDLGVAEFYHNKGNYGGAMGRIEEIKNKYKNFSMMDRALYLEAVAQMKTNNNEEAAITLGKIVSAYPFSKHAEEAKAMLNSLGKSIPPVDSQLAATNQSLVKVPEGFSPLKPFIQFAEALGFKGPPDVWLKAKKTIEDEKAKTEGASKSGEGGKGGDVDMIEGVIKKSSSGEAGTASPSIQPASQEKKKEEAKPIRRRKKPE